MTKDQEKNAMIVIRQRYDELVLAADNGQPEESRYQTALRYVKEGSRRHGTLQNKK